jgi:hypothetical protein
MAASSGPLAALGSADALSIGLAPSVAMGMTYVSMADSIGLEMANAVANQQRGQVVAGAALVQVLTLIIAAGSAKAGSAKP